MDYTRIVNVSLTVGVPLPKKPGLRTNPGVSKILGVQFGVLI